MGVTRPPAPPARPRAAGAGPAGRRGLLSGLRFFEHRGAFARRFCGFGSDWGSRPRVFREAAGAWACGAGAASSLLRRLQDAALSRAAACRGAGAGSGAYEIRPLAGRHTGRVLGCGDAWR